ncbi:hypothetical protein HYC85_011444 [Camellia sinensis]|uniref:PHD-type domain-containing protein n=1 Tax=Camellia sinensis TaxID=4442 RepID=A0A7J7HB14_CAMSI|nr:hypothetical protein HYC85_011444 [Camellia sinensis]
MDSNHSAEDSGSLDPLEATRSDDLEAAVGEKRTAENGELGVPAAKKARNVKKVAEIVLVLAAMGKMRGGRSPTAAEKEMMVEAREKLVEVCEEFAPKDVFPRDAFGAVIEDLGLNKLKEQRLGFRPPKVSIAEKLLFTKQKMEKSEEFSVRTATHSSQRVQTNLGTAAESRGALHTTKMFPSDKPSPAPNSSGGFQPASPLVHVKAANSTSLPYQLPASEVRTSVVSSGLPTSLLGRDSSSSVLPRVDRPHVRLDPRSNGSSYMSQIQVNSSGDHTPVKTPAWSQQSLTVSSGKTGPDNKVLPHPSVKVDRTADLTASRVAPQAATSKPLITQTTSGHMPTMHHHVQGIHFVQAPLLSNGHSEISKIVQKLLQPKLPGQPTWTPPSRDYMSKALTCQVCKLTINEVENVLICDACEKGYHLKCLQSHNQKGVPRGEWHCFKCLSLSNGKTLPPKYGRVTRNINAPKVMSIAATVQSSPEKKVATLGEKGNQQKITANGSSGLQSAPAGSMGNSLNQLNAIELQGNDILSSREKMDDKRHFETCPNDKIRTPGPACVSSAAGSSVERPIEEKLALELKGQSASKPSEIGSKMLDHLHASSDPQDNDQKGLLNSAEIPLMQCHDSNDTVKYSGKSHSSKNFDGNPNDEIKQKEQGVVRSEPVEISGTITLASEHARPSSDGSHDVDWIGDILQVVDEKTYYQSCCINGVVYEVQDHALFHSKNDKLMPSKLQAMWEDNKTRSKWVIVNRCYFPDDLPEAVGRPCYPESNEVYESNHGSTIMAGLIRGPCEVLPPGKFIEENERRSRVIVISVLSLLEDDGSPLIRDKIGGKLAHVKLI